MTSRLQELAQREHKGRGLPWQPLKTRQVRRYCSSSGGEGLSSWRCPPLCHSRSSSGEEKKRARVGVTGCCEQSNSQQPKSIYSISWGKWRPCQREALSATQRPLADSNRRGTWNKAKLIVLRPPSQGAGKQVGHPWENRCQAEPNYSSEDVI